MIQSGFLSRAFVPSINKQEHRKEILMLESEESDLKVPRFCTKGIQSRTFEVSFNALFDQSVYSTASPFK